MADLREVTADEVMNAIASALKARDFPAAVDLLHVLAVKDPASAEAIYETIKRAGGIDG
jgi:hypothetical protein